MFPGLLCLLNYVNFNFSLVKYNDDDDDDDDEADDDDDDDNAISKYCRAQWCVFSTGIDTFQKNNWVGDSYKELWR